MNLRECLLDLLFPPRCPFCGQLLDHIGICDDCLSRLFWTGESTILLDNTCPCTSPLWYRDEVRQGLLRLKFRGASYNAEPLGRLLAQYMSDNSSVDWDIVTWTPVSRQRLRKRGYDQAELLARSACGVWHTKPVRLLRKIVHNAAQSSLSGGPEARRNNVRGAYRTVNPNAVSGRRILLIDDIVTTGSTLLECVRTLQSAGAAQVRCATVARTPHGEDGQIPVENEPTLEELPDTPWS